MADDRQQALFDKGGPRSICLDNEDLLARTPRLFIGRSREWPARAAEAGEMMTRPTALGVMGGA